MANAWINQMFRAKAAKTGGTLRRKLENVEKYASVAELTAVVKAKNFHLILIEGQAVVLCNPGRMKVVC